MGAWDSAAVIALGLVAAACGGAAPEGSPAACWAHKAEAFSGHIGERRPLTDVIDVSAGHDHTCAVISSGQVVCWGSDFSGEISGHWRRQAWRRPTVVEGVADAVQVSAGGAGTCAVLATGRVSCWGLDWYAGRGLRTWGATSNPPAPVTGVDDAQQVSVSGGHACALRRTGEVVCWGDNTHGQVGAQDLGWYNLPVKVRDVSRAVEVVAGNAETCARLVPGRVLCWGTDTGRTWGEPRRRPVAVPGLEDAIDLAAGAFHTCAARKTGEVVCWGTNGALGDPAVPMSSAPVVVVGVHDAVAVAAGTATSCALRRGGQVACWGYSYPDYGRTSGPIGVERLTGAEQVTVGGFMACARRADHTVACWGRNDVGQLGDGTTDRQPVPGPPVSW